MLNKNIKTGVAALAALFLIGLSPVMAVTFSAAQAKVVITGDFNVKLSGFLDPQVYVADAQKYTYSLLLVVAYPFVGQADVYFPQGLKPGTYPISDQTGQRNPVRTDFYCITMMSGDSSGCDYYTGYAKGIFKLTKTGKVYSGSLDAVEETLDGRHKVHVVTTFADLPLIK